MKKPILFITNQWHEKDCQKLGICNNDYSILIKNLAEMRDYLDNACILAFSPSILYNIFNNMEISYQTEQAFQLGINTIYVPDKEYFVELCEASDKNKSIEQAWLSVFYEISDDISTLEERYSGNSVESEFLRSLLIYISKFKITDIM